MLERRALTSRFCMQAVRFRPGHPALHVARRAIAEEGSTLMTSPRVIVSAAFVFATALTAQALVQQGAPAAPATPPQAGPPPSGERGQAPPGGAGQGRGGGRGN